MTRIVLEEYIRKNSGEFARTRLRMERERKALRRRRSPEEKAIFLKLDRTRWQRWLEEGRVEIVGPRKFRLRVTEE